MAKELSQLEQTVLEIINKSVSAIEKGADWLSGQIPDVAEQFLRYKLFESIFLTLVFFTLFLLVTVVSPLIFRKLYLSVKKQNGYTNPDNFVFPDDVTEDDIIMSDRIVKKALAKLTEKTADTSTETPVVELTGLMARKNKEVV